MPEADDTTASHATAAAAAPAGAAGLRAYRRLAVYALPHTRGWLLIGAVSLVGSVLALLEPWPLKILVDHVLGDVAPAGLVARLIDLLPGAGDPAGLLLWVVAGGLIIIAVSLAGEAYLAFAWIRVGQRMAYDLAQDLLAHLQRQSLLFHARTPVGDSMSRVTTDSYCLYTLASALLIAPARALVLLALMVAVMLALEPFLTLVAVSVAPLMAWASYHFGQPIRGIAHQRRAIEAGMESHVQRILRNIPAVKAFAQGPRERQRLAAYADEALRVHRKGAVAAALFEFGGGFAGVVGTAAVMGFGAGMVLAGHLTIGGLLIFLSYLGTLHGEFRGLLGIYATVQNAGASVDRVMAVLDADEAVAERADAVPLPRVRGRIDLESVSFGYRSGAPVLQDISLTVAPGETLALVGATGAGKSTLAGLIPRFVDPQQGRVLLDGRDVRSVTLASLREQIALVLQEPFLFPISIADNIAYGRPHARRAEIVAAARAANADGFIERLPERYDSVLGERGATLSGGERQRIAIARALLKDAPVLILDEPTSALDVATEHHVLEALERLMQGRTTLIVAHRFSTLRHASRIAVLDGGRLAELGTHDDLLSRRGIYWGLRTAGLSGAA
jgi:ATP-binding cassette, subfamily B, bacterial